MAGRLGDDQKERVPVAAIEDLMGRLGGYGEAGEGREAMLFAIYFDDELAVENVEKLRRVLVEVALLRGRGRHALFDHAERCGAMQMPAVAVLFADGAGPCVVLGAASADGFHRRRPPDIG